MSHMKTYRDPQISLFQAAVSEAVARKSGIQTLSANNVAIPVRPTTEDPLMDAVSAYADDMQSPKPTVPAGAAIPVTLGIVDGAKYCANMALKLGEAIGKAMLTGDTDGEKRYRDQLGRFGACDVRWSTAAALYAEYFVAQHKSIPYISIKTIPDPVIPLKGNKIAIVGDWGTGQPAATLVLQEVCNKQPDVVIHLGDVYYAGTQYEFDNYFTNVWRQVFGSSPSTTGTPAVFNLAGNHDMYSGGVAYYNLLKSMGQPASFFCLQNDNWQFLAMDTGLHDCDPLGKAPTMLDRDEKDWLVGKILAAEGKKKTILLSHHQLFSTFEQIGSTWINANLVGDLNDVLPKVAAWIWGHEHNLVIYKKYLNILGRCAGHGAFPVGIDEGNLVSNPSIPIEDVHLDKGQSFYRHGFVMIELNADKANVSYYQDNAPNNPLYTETL